MEEILKYIIIVASLLTKVTITADNTETIQPRYDYPQIINICKVNKFVFKFYCHCNNNATQAAKTAYCYIFTKGLTESSSNWVHFSSQLRLELLTISAPGIDKNKLTFIPAKAIVRLEKLKYLTIKSGNIKNIPPYSFTKSSFLENLTLKSDNIHTLEKHAFSHMKSLKNLSLTENLITEIIPDVFINLPNLHILDISKNNISCLRDGCFKHLTNLRQLTLENNYISVIVKETLEGLDNLASLNIRNNKIRMIGSLTFSYVGGLQSLKLDFNHIALVSDRGFEGLNHLKMLNLSHNKLPSIDEKVLADTPNLLLVDLGYNRLEMFAYEYIMPLIEKSVSAIVHLEGNPFACDCRLAWVYKLRSETEQYQLQHVLGKVTCAEELPERPASDKEKNHTSEKTSDDEYYEEPEDAYDKNKNYKLILLTDIPVEDLPCNDEQPDQKESRLRDANKVGKIQPFYYIILIFVLVSLLI